jgi:DNA-binding transcriptional LysR family regulator
MITDRNVDLVAEGVDIAIRAGELQDSGLVARKIGTSQWIPVASPTYLRSAGTPGHPSDLREHVCLQFTPLGLDGWKLTDGRRTTIVPLKRQLVSNEIGFLKQLAVTANGVALLASHVCSNELASGELVRVLPTWSARSAPVHVVYPSQPFVAPKVRVFVDMAMEQLGSIFTP